MTSPISYGFGYAGWEYWVVYRPPNYIKLYDRPNALAAWCNLNPSNHGDLYRAVKVYLGADWNIGLAEFLSRINMSVR